jgi:hypothetical protein
MQRGSRAKRTYRVSGAGNIVMLQRDIANNAAADPGFFEQLGNLSCLNSAVGFRWPVPGEANDRRMRSDIGRQGTGPIQVARDTL